MKHLIQQLICYNETTNIRLYQVTIYDKRFVYLCGVSSQSINKIVGFPAILCPLSSPESVDKRQKVLETRIHYIRRINFKYESAYPTTQKS